MAAEGGNIIWFTYTGADDEVIPLEATHILVQARVIRRNAFRNHRNIVEVICDEDVERVEEGAFFQCPSLKRVIMRGVKAVEQNAFQDCRSLEDVESGKLKIIGTCAFAGCASLRIINLQSARIVGRAAFACCESLMDVKVSIKLKRIGEFAFRNCYSLKRITLPLKDGLFTRDNQFLGCDNLQQVDLIEGELLHGTITAFHFEEWRNDMNEEINSINQILPSAEAGSRWHMLSPGEKAREIQRWIRSVLDKIIHYKAEHRRLLSEAAMTLELVSPNYDIVMNNVLPFLELPSYTFEVEDDEED